MNPRKSIKKIEFENICYELNNEIQVFKDISFSFPTKDIIWVKSEAGVGKSSLFQIVDGLVQPSSGSYKLNDQCVEDMSFDEFNNYRLNIGYSFDFGGMINNRTLYQNLSLPLEYHNIFDEKKRHSKVGELLSAFGLAELSELRPSSVPGSVRKAMCVARAFVHEPQIILLDDPTTGLRAEVKSKLKIIIKEYIADHKNSAIFIATDDFEFISDIASQQIVLKKNSLEYRNIKENAA